MSSSYTVVQTSTEPPPPVAVSSPAAAAVRRRSSQTRRRSSLLHDSDQVFDDADRNPTSFHEKWGTSSRKAKHHLLPSLESGDADEGDGSFADNSDEGQRHPSAALPSGSLPPEDGVRVTVTTSIKTTQWRDYWNVLVTYPKYRYYLLSHVCQHMGDWFVRVASLLFVEQAGGGSGKSLALLVLSDHLPRIVFAQVGGFLSDRFDRRRLMIGMDILAGVGVLGFLFAARYHSLPLLYVTSTVRASIAAAYYPVTSGMVPLLVSNVRDVQLATTINSWAWSTMAILGGVVAGSATAVIGVQTCYIIDCLTYFLSAALVFFGISGSFRVRDGAAASPTGGDRNDRDAAPPPPRVASRSCQSFRELAAYLATCGFGLLVLMKASAGLVWGPEDVIGAEFATVRDEDGNEEEGPSSFRMGLLFSTIGCGTLVGPALANLVTDANHPRTLQRSCVVALMILTVGWLCISRVNTFPGFLAGTLLRTMGSGIAWPTSTVILQTLVDKEILGRVLALEFVCITVSESLSATVTGALSDHGLSVNSLALFGASLGLATVCFWGTYHSMQLGAAKPKFNPRHPDTSDETSMVPSREVELPRKGIIDEFEEEFV